MRVGGCERGRKERVRGRERRREKVGKEGQDELDRGRRG